MQKKIYKYIIIFKSKYILSLYNLYKIILYKIEIWNFTHSMFKKLLYRSLNMILQNNISIYQ